MAVEGENLRHVAHLCLPVVVLHQLGLRGHLDGAVDSVRDGRVRDVVAARQQRIARLEGELQKEKRILELEGELAMLKGQSAVQSSNLRKQHPHSS